MVGLACGFRNAKSVCACLHQLDGGRERYSMALGDVDWPDAVPGSKHRADMFTLEGERSRRARLDSGLSVLTHQQRLGTADARSVEKQSHVASDAEPPRMGQAVSVDQDQARLSTQSSEGCQQQRA